MSATMTDDRPQTSSFELPELRSIRREFFREIRNTVEGVSFVTLGKDAFGAPLLKVGLVSTEVWAAPDSYRGVPVEVEQADRAHNAVGDSNAAA